MATATHGHGGGHGHRFPNFPNWVWTWLAVLILAFFSILFLKWLLAPQVYVTETGRNTSGHNYVQSRQNIDVDELTSENGTITLLIPREGGYYVCKKYHELQSTERFKIIGSDNVPHIFSGTRFEDGIEPDGDFLFIQPIDPSSELTFMRK